MYSTVKCPHCCRMFAESAALRHIPICIHIVNKPKTLEDKKSKFSPLLIISSVIVSVNIGIQSQTVYSAG